MITITLELEKSHKGKAYRMKSCPPFVINSRGHLVHRPRYGALFNIHKNPHIAFKFMCGMCVSTHANNLTMTDSLDDQILCERCEAVAVKRGFPSADQLSGRHVHKGKTIAVRTCCQEEVGNADQS